MSLCPSNKVNQQVSKQIKLKVYYISPDEGTRGAHTSELQQIVSPFLPSLIGAVDTEQNVGRGAAAGLPFNEIPQD